MFDILRGLAYIHNRQPYSLLHRDIKPTNILLTKSKVAKITDFGLSKLSQGLPMVNSNNNLSLLVVFAGTYIDCVNGINVSVPTTVCFKSEIAFLPPRKGERYASALTNISNNNNVIRYYGKINLKDYITSFIKAENKKNENRKLTKIIKKKRLKL